MAMTKKILIADTDENLKCIPVILISANDGILHARVQEKGVDDYLSKIFGTGKWVARIKKYIIP